MFDGGLKNKYKTKNTTSLKGRRNVVPPSFMQVKRLTPRIGSNVATVLCLHKKLGSSIK